jgi:tetratricopeptide (TPR) repeat protein
MINRLIYTLLVIATAFASGEVSAQKYPERRVAREGNRLYEEGDYGRSEVEYRRALEANPELGDANFNLAGALFKQQKYEEAARIYADFAQDSTATAQHLAEANYNLGNVMLAGQKTDEAIELYKQALRLNPSDQQAKYNLAYAKKMKREQQQQQQQQNQDQNQDNQERENNQNQNNDNSQNQQDKQEGQDNQEQKEDQDQQNNEGDKPQPDNGEKPQPSGEQEASITPHEAEQMLEAIQGEEDKTREKVNAKEVKGVARSGKNW